MSVLSAASTSSFSALDLEPIRLRVGAITELTGRPVNRREADRVTEELLDDPYEAYQELRDLGPVVHLQRLDMFAITRYDEVKACLVDDTTFCTGPGVALNDLVNDLSRGTTLASDGGTHRIQREIIGRPSHLQQPRAAARH